MTTLEERVARLEGSYEHLASRSELAELKTEIVKLESQIALLTSRVELLESRLSSVESRLGFDGVPAILDGVPAILDGVPAILDGVPDVLAHATGGVNSRSSQRAGGTSTGFCVSRRGLRRQSRARESWTSTTRPQIVMDRPVLQSRRFKDAPVKIWMR